MSKWTRAAVAFVGLIGLVVFNFLAIAFMWGYLTALSATSTGLIAAVGACVFVAPFNYALFQEVIGYVKS